MAPKTENIDDGSSLKLQQDGRESPTVDVATTKKVEGLKKNEVCIDGGIYDIDDFDHPGGDTLKVFGGNDVTVFYKMIHPNHKPNQYAQKMKKLGTIPDYQCEYSFETEFAKEVKDEVFKIVKRGREFGTPGYFFRAITYVVIFFSLMYCWAVHGSSYSLAIIYGISCASIGLNVQHDANHGAASRKHWVNDLLGFGADLIGGNKWIWMEKHWTHHAYTNHKDKDPDGLSAEPLVLFNSYPVGHENRKWYHSFQAFFVIPVLSLYWLSTMVSFGDIWELSDYNASHIGMNFENDFVVKRRKWAMLSRIFHVFIHIVTPFLHHGMTLDTLGHIAVFGASGSLGLGMLFFLSHNFEGADRDPTQGTRESGKSTCWFKAQVETSCTYGGFISGCLTGGLNFQVEHHLFPRMSSAWYPYIAPKVREVCAKHGVKYVYYPWMWQNLISTLKFVNLMGNPSIEKVKTN